MNRNVVSWDRDIEYDDYTAQSAANFSHLGGESQFGESDWSGFQHDLEHELENKPVSELMDMLKQLQEERGETDSLTEAIEDLEQRRMELESMDGSRSYISSNYSDIDFNTDGESFLLGSSQGNSRIPRSTMSVLSRSTSRPESYNNKIRRSNTNNNSVRFGSEAGSYNNNSFNSRNESNNVRPPRTPSTYNSSSRGNSTYDQHSSRNEDNSRRSRRSDNISKYSNSQSNSNSYRRKQHVDDQNHNDKENLPQNIMYDEPDEISEVTGKHTNVRSSGNRSRYGSRDFDTSTVGNSSIGRTEQWAKLSARVSSIVLESGNGNHHDLADKVASCLISSGMNYDRKGMKHQEALSHVAADVSTIILEGGGDQGLAAKVTLAIVSSKGSSSSKSSSSSDTDIHHNNINSYTSRSVSKSSRHSKRRDDEEKSLKQRMDNDRDRLQEIKDEQRELDEEEEELMRRGAFEKEKGSEDRWMQSFLEADEDRKNLEDQLADLRSTKSSKESLDRDEKKIERKIRKKLKKSEETKKKMLRKLKKYKQAEEEQKKKHIDLMKKKAAAESLKRKYEESFRQLESDLRKLQKDDYEHKVALAENVLATKEEQVILEERKRQAVEDEAKSKMVESELLYRIAEAEADKAKLTEELRAVEKLISKTEQTAIDAENERDVIESEIIEKIRAAEEEKIRYNQKANELEEENDERRKEDMVLMQMMAKAEAERKATANKFSELEEADNMLKRNEKELQKQMAAAQTDLLIKRMHATANPLEMGNHNNPYVPADDGGTRGILRNKKPVGYTNDYNVPENFQDDDDSSSSSSRSSDDSEYSDDEQKDYLDVLGKALERGIKDGSKLLAFAGSKLMSSLQCLNPDVSPSNKKRGKHKHSDDDSSSSGSRTNYSESVLGVNNPYLTQQDFQLQQNFEIPTFNPRPKNGIPISRNQQNNFAIPRTPHSMLSRADDDVDGLLKEVDGMLSQTKQNKPIGPKTPKFLSKVNTNFQRPNFIPGGTPKTPTVSAFNNSIPPRKTVSEPAFQKNNPTPTFKQANNMRPSSSFASGPPSVMSSSKTSDPSNSRFKKMGKKMKMTWKMKKK